MVARAGAFDGVADTYDAQFTQTRLGRWLRASVWAELDAAFAPGDRVLELGCGTGADAVWLAARGIDVVATDASPAMLEMARRKAAAAGVAERVQLQPLDLNGLQRRDDRVQDVALEAQGPFDGVLSNFGALNCLPERRAVAATLATWLRAGGRVVLVVMGPFCPWEVGWHLMHGQPRTATRRWRPAVPVNVGDGTHVTVWYPSPRRLRAEFTPWFHHRKTAGIGALLPPPYLGHLVERWPRFFQKLAAWERRWGGRFPLNWFNDHYLVLFEKRGEGAS